jgi:hypothetical protein
VARRFAFLAIAAAIAAFMGSALPARAASLSIAVSGNHLIDGTGQPVRLLGVNRSGTEYACVQWGGIFDGPSDDASVSAIASWHVNAVRVPLNEDCWLGINGEPVGTLTAAGYQQAIQQYVQILHNHGMYAILELHWSAPGTAKATGQQAMVDADHGAAFWSGVASAFKNDPAVLFDLYNEPQFISWPCWRDGTGCPVAWAVAGMQSLVSAVRATGATQPIMLGGVAYANDLSQWLAYEPTDSQHALIASDHTYNFNTCNTISCWNSTVAPVAAQVPVVAGEIGENDGGHGFIDSFMGWADPLGISYLAWTWDTWGCGGPVLISDYSGTPCQTFGSGYQAHLAQIVIPTPPGPPGGVTALAGNAAATVAWSPAAANGSPITSYAVTPWVNSVAQAATTVNGAITSAVITGLSNGTSYTFTVTATNAKGTGPASASSNSVTAGGGAYQSLSPARILDTRVGSGAPKQPIGPNSAINVQVTGVSGVPSTGVAAVVMNVTVTNTTAASYLTVWPAGLPRPTASNLNWPAGKTVPNLVEVGVGLNGQVSAYNAGGSTDLIFDVAGYVAVPPAGTNGLFNPVVPFRILDTRTGNGASQSHVGAGQSISVRVAGVLGSGVPATGVSAVVLNVTVTNPSAASYLTVWPSGTAMPLASNLNFLAGQTVPNRVIIGLGSSGSVSIYNAAGSADVIADVGGWFTDSANTAGGAVFVALSPSRILDTRTTQTPLAPGAMIALPVAGQGGVPTAMAKAVVLNVTVTNPSAPSYLTVWPDGTARPLASDLNYSAALTVANLVVVQVGGDGKLGVFNAAGSVDVIADVVGYYY